MWNSGLEGSPATVSCAFKELWLQLGTQKFPLSPWDASELLLCVPQMLLLWDELPCLCVWTAQILLGDTPGLLARQP